MNNLFHMLIFIAIFSWVNGGLFDRSSGKKVDDATAKELKSRNAIENCAIELAPCAPHEGSRVDGTCNNFKYPSRGSARGPYLRILTNHGNSSAQGTKNELPSARKVRTTLQSTGRVEDKRGFTTAAVHYLDFITRDITAMDGDRDFLQKRLNCCKPEGKSDPRCFPIMVPDDDPYLRMTDIRCLNFSRAESFQDVGCSASVTSGLASKINYQTPVLDLSTIYGVDEHSLETVREYKDGLLKLEKRGDRYLPFDLLKNYNVAFKVINGTEDNKTVSNDSKRVVRDDVCIQNEGNETACYRFGFPELGNYDLRTTTMEIFFMREHNRLASALRKLNPCWKDDRLFKVARQINIATAANIFLYELMPLFLGYGNMVNFGLVSEGVEHLTAYDEDEVPLVYAEFDIAVRFFHTMLEGRIKRYDENYHYVGEFPFSGFLFKQSLIEDEKVMGEINRGTFYQSASKIDDIQDPEISENFFGKLQRAHDLAAMDIQRERDMNISGYNDYRNLCGLVRAKKFEDYLDVIDFEKMLALKNLYKDVNEVDLLAGIMSERFIKGTFVSNTLFCIIAKQLQLLRFADRFWFERGDQFHSFSLPQLREIRRTNMARLACDNAEGITYMQPRAFLNIGHGNTLIPCTHIPGPDLSSWDDSSCHKRFQPVKSVKDNELFRYDWMKLQKSSQPSSMSNMMMDYSSFFDSFLKF